MNDEKTKEATGTEGRVCEDIAARQRLGLEKYGTTVEGNPLSLTEWLQHAYEETLDQAVYLKRAIEEQSNSQSEGSRSHKPFDLVYLKNHTDRYRVYSRGGDMIFVGQNSDTVRSSGEAEVESIIEES